MARLYAGILGPLAMLTAIGHGMIHGGGVKPTMFAAWCCLWLFAGLGYLLGAMGDMLVSQSVRARIADEIAAEPTPETQTKRGNIG